MNESEKYESIWCPFCGYNGIESKPGKSVYPVCDAAFEIDDRVECVFVDPDNPRLPIEGTVCMSVVLCRGKRLKILFIVVPI